MRYRIFLIICACVLVTWPTKCTLADQLLAGVAVADITPPIPYRMSGYFNERLSTGVKDPLQAKAVVLRQGEASAALVFCDLIGMSLELSTRARELASEATGIPTEHIVAAATHSHTGPLYFGELREHFHQRAVERQGSDPLEKVDYPAMLVAQIVAAVVQANSAVAPVELASGTVQQTGLSFNRRFHMKDGTVRFNPGRLNADILRAAGPIDPQVGAIWLTRPGKRQPVAAIASFALHLDTVGGTEYSADYPKFIEKSLQNAFGPEFTLLYGTGTCGDINHIDVTTEDSLTTDEIGTGLAATLQRARDAHRFVRIDEPALAAKSTVVHAPVQQYSAAEIAQARDRMDLVGTRELSFLDQVQACTIRDLELRQVDELALEVQAFRLGPETAIVTLPGEVFVELGLAIKAASPFQTTLVVELANDDPAYIPTKKGFAEGSYEIVNSRIQPGGGERLVEAAIELLRQLK